MRPCPLQPIRPVRCARHAFTLIELLVVLAVIGVLTALLMPAVQAARESSRRAMCTNNLRQMGLALQGYHAKYGKFPPGGIEPRTPRRPKARQLAWSAYLLPYLDQMNLYDELDLRKPFDAPENAEAAATRLAVYVCPSAASGAGLRDGRGPCQYGGIYGERITGRNNPPKGVMIYDRAFGFSDISDGTSTTLVISEDSEFKDGQWINGRNLFDQAFAINQAPPFENDIRSEHPSGANGLFCDGSVRFLNNDLDLNILAAICTRAGGEIVPAID